MIERIHITNFQAHEDTLVKLDPQVTTIVGPSDRGKSAVLRALRWVVQNRPSGVDFIRQGAGQAVVRVQVDGQAIARTRTKSRNTYELDGHVYEAFGQDVPPDIAKLVQLGDLNFQGQHDAPYWFCKTPGEVSRELNEIINLGLIDQVLGQLNGRLRTATTEIQVITLRLDQARQSRKAKRWATEANSALAQVEQLRENALETGETRARLCDLLQQAQEHAQSQRRGGLVLDQGRAVVALGTQWAASRAKAAQLRRALAEVRKLKAQVQAPIPPIGPLLALHQSLRTTQKRVTALRGLLADAVKLDAKRTKGNEELTKLKGIKRCPTCGQMIL